MLKRLAYIYRLVVLMPASMTWIRICSPVGKPTGLRYAHAGFSCYEVGSLTVWSHEWGILSARALGGRALN
jgi:hypothetical protein